MKNIVILDFYSTGSFRSHARRKVQVPFSQL